MFSPKHKFFPKTSYFLSLSNTVTFNEKEQIFCLLFESKCLSVRGLIISLLLSLPLAVDGKFKLGMGEMFVLPFFSYL